MDDSINDLQKLSITFDILNGKSANDFCVYNKYLKQPEIVYHVLFDAITRTENSLNNKWNMNIILDDSDFSRVSGKLLDEVYDKYQKADTLGAFTSNETVNEIKQNVNETLINDLEKYKTEKNISNDIFLEIKKDAIEIFNRNFDEQIEKILKLDTKNELKVLCEEWNDAYSKLDYNLMNSVAAKVDELYNGQYLFKDEQLNKDIKYILVKNEYINKKLEMENEGKLSEIEEEIFEQMKNGNML